ncbi:MAG: hypothetical protein N3D73_00895 [Candidatus Diapherotrites archaeon]|nr:hypothetical protein [Candidatus Diapherotrites archaeon]
MACFLVPLFLGIILLMLKKQLPERLKINFLLWMIFGGSMALAIEHIAHQEIVPWPPFLTAMKTPEETAVMIEEMFSVGVPMTLALLGAWILIVYLYRTENILETTAKTELSDN